MGLKVMLYDATQRSLEKRFLSLPWGVGGRLFGRFDVRIAARSRAHAYEQLDELKGQGELIDHLAFWGHGGPEEALIDGQPLETWRLAAVTPFHPDSELWLRCCGCFRGRDGQAYAVELVETLRIGVAAHTRTISGEEDGDPSWRSILYQSGLYGLRPGEAPYWDPTDRGGSRKNAPRTVSILEHRLPDWAFQPR